ncbi:maleylpyruvate isomerase family mycothiol-dependent enzyme [Kocuria sp. CPCC 205292]|uniref:maleylpyruvate isomerase family mycothiol-dependent enzyme n=1 Tax=Kocuria cellulosilytica TaxID=3071451 RepID=UPI0034D46908
MVARHDLTTDEELKAQLLLVRRGTAFWSRKVNELTDDELDGPTLLPGWTRRHLIAHVGYNARALTRLVQWANTGVETPMYSSPAARNAEIAYGATLPPRALRHLNDHAAVSLNVEWRDTPDPAWAHEVRTAQGRTVPAMETVWMRNREVWLHAVDLNNGARFADVPTEVLARLLREITNAWAARGTDPGLRIQVDGSPVLDELGAGAGRECGPVVRGDLAAVVQWASGRGGHRLREGADVLAPRWL